MLKGSCRIAFISQHAAIGIGQLGPWTRQKIIALRQVNKLLHQRVSAVPRAGCGIRNVSRCCSRIRRDGRLEIPPGIFKVA